MNRKTNTKRNAYLTLFFALFFPLVVAAQGGLMGVHDVNEASNGIFGKGNGINSSIVITNQDFGGGNANITNQTFGEELPIGSGLLLLLAVSAFYAVVKYIRNKESNH